MRINLKIVFIRSEHETLEQRDAVRWLSYVGGADPCLVTGRVTDRVPCHSQRKTLLYIIVFFPYFLLYNFTLNIDRTVVALLQSVATVVAQCCCSVSF